MAGLISQYSGQSIEGMQQTNSGDIQRVVMTTAMTGTTTLSGKKSVEVLVKDANDNEQLCVATVNFGTVSSSSIESVNGKVGTVVLSGSDIKTTSSGTTMVSDDISSIKTDLDDLGDQVQGIEAKMPSVPSTNGSYYLKATRSGSTVTYVWEEA